MLEMARGKMIALASASGNPTFQRGFVADFIGSSHAPPPDTTQAGDTRQAASGDQGTFSFTRLFPMFGSAQAFLGFLAGLLPLPIANASVAIASPTVTVCDTPLGLMIPMGAKSCSDIPVVPNAMVMGFTNVMTGMSIGDFLGALAWNMLRDGATHGFQAGLKAAGNAAARRISKSNSPRLQNAAQRVNDFVGGENCIARGHPVDVVSGTVFTRVVDFELYSAQNATFARFYNSRAEAPPGDASALGPGWRHAFDEALLADDASDGVATLALRDREGRILGFDLPLVDGERDFHPAERLTLTRVDGRTYSVRDAADVERVFRFSGGETGTAAAYRPPPGKRARLVQVRTPSGGEGLRLRWEKDRLLGFTDAAEREVVVTHDAAGRMTELRLVRARGTACDVFLAAYEYTADGRLAAHRDRNGNRQVYRYDRRGRLAQETDRNGYSYHFLYDDLDRCTHTYGDDNAFWCAFDYQPSVTRVTDGAGAVTRYQYDDKLARVVAIHDAEGGLRQQTWTPESWLESTTDAGGYTSTWSWDAQGRLIGVADPMGGTVEQVHDPAGRLIAMVDPTGRRWSCERDARGNVLASHTPAGRERRLERDALGRVVQVAETDATWRRTWAHGQVKEEVYPDGVRCEFTYDVFGHLTQEREVAPDGQDRRTTWTRDAEGRITAVAGPGGQQESYDYLPEGQPTRLTVGSRTARRRYTPSGRIAEHEDPLGRRTHLTYDGDLRVVTIQQPGDRLWHYSRDKVGRVERMRTPDGVVVRYLLDPNGLPVEERRPGRTIRRFFDGNGRLTKAVFGPQDTVHIRYDAAGRMVEIKGRDDRTVKRSYDADGLLITEVQGEAAIRWRYDGRGRVTRRTTSWGSTTRTAFAGDGAIGLVDPAGGEHRFGRDAWGRRHRWRQPEGATRRMAWDDRDRLLEDRLELPGGEVATDRRLFWSDDDTIVGLEERTPDLRRRHEYRYDAAGRLVGWRQDDHDEVSWRLDAADNVLQEPGKATRRFRADRLEGDDDGRRYRYDRRGRTTRIASPEGQTRLWYDDRDRLVRVHTPDDRIVHHRYDVLGRRVETLAEQTDGRVTTEHLYWDGGQLARRVVAGAPGTCPRDEEYVFDPEHTFTPLLRVVSDGSQGKNSNRVEYFHTDQRGAVVGVRDGAGATVWAGRYDAAGRCDTPDALTQPLRLAGQLVDTATGLAHHRHRVFEPESGRFLSPDPLGIFGGDNTYGYPVDPIRLADPLGLECDDAGSTAYPYRARVQLQEGHTHIANAVIESHTPITARQVEQAMRSMTTSLSGGAGPETVTPLGTDGSQIRTQVHRNGYGGIAPAADGASAQMSKTMRERVVPTGGVTEGGNPRWGREQLTGDGRGTRLDFENLAGHNLQSNR